MQFLKAALAALSLWLGREWSESDEVLEKADVPFSDVLGDLAERHGVSFADDLGMRMLEHLSRTACCRCNPTDHAPHACIQHGFTESEEEEHNEEFGAVVRHLRTFPATFSLESALKMCVPEEVRDSNAPLWSTVSSLDCICQMRSGKRDGIRKPVAETAKVQDEETVEAGEEEEVEQPAVAKAPAKVTAPAVAAKNEESDQAKVTNPTEALASATPELEVAVAA